VARYSRFAGEELDRTPVWKRRSAGHSLIQKLDLDRRMVVVSVPDIASVLYSQSVEADQAFQPVGAPSRVRYPRSPIVS
jgi:hypothetical protein